MACPELRVRPKFLSRLLTPTPHSLMSSLRPTSPTSLLLPSPGRTFANHRSRLHKHSKFIPVRKPLPSPLLRPGRHSLGSRPATSAWLQYKAPFKQSSAFQRGLLWPSEGHLTIRKDFPCLFSVSPPRMLAPWKQEPCLLCSLMYPQHLK